MEQGIIKFKDKVLAVSNWYDNDLINIENIENVGIKRIELNSPILVTPISDQDNISTINLISAYYTIDEDSINLLTKKLYKIMVHDFDKFNGSQKIKELLVNRISNRIEKNFFIDLNKLTVKDDDIITEKEINISKKLLDEQYSYHHFSNNFVIAYSYQDYKNDTNFLNTNELIEVNNQQDLYHNLKIIYAFERIICATIREITNDILNFTWNNYNENVNDMEVISEIENKKISILKLLQIKKDVKYIRILLSTYQGKEKGKLINILSDGRNDGVNIYKLFYLLSDIKITHHPPSQHSISLVTLKISSEISNNLLLHNNSLIPPFTDSNIDTNNIAFFKNNVNISEVKSRLINYNIPWYIMKIGDFLNIFNYIEKLKDFKNAITEDFNSQEKSAAFKNSTTNEKKKELINHNNKLINIDIIIISLYQNLIQTVFLLR